MASVLQSLAALAAAGTMLFSNAANQAAPQNDVDGLLFLINRGWRVSENYVPELRTADVQGSVKQMRPDAATALEEMFAVCKEETGKTPVSVSGYRSYSKQETIYNNKLKRVSGSVEKADAYVARPGASEHQLGLAMDVGQKNKTSLTEGFANTECGQWLAENCWRFGFILRYQQGWEDVTGYNYEPWHVRYVGKENAEAIYQDLKPLEEYLVEVRTQAMLDILMAE